MPKPYEFDNAKWFSIYSNMTKPELRTEAFELKKKHMELQQKADWFANSVSCLLAEGVEFYTTSEIHDSVQKECFKLIEAVKGDYKMDMPCQCEICGEWFELNDGNPCGVCKKIYCDECLDEPFDTCLDCRE